MFLSNWFCMIIGSKIFYKHRVQNSLDWAQENIENFPDGSIFIADEHEITRGRLGRSWVFDKDQLVITLLLKPEKLNIISKKYLELRLKKLNMAITLGVLKPLKRYGINLKWPNDFYFQGKKVGGILAKTIWDGNLPKAVIFGFALNVNNKVPVLDNKLYEAISLSEIIGRKLDKELLFNELLKSMDSFYQDWLNCKYEDLFKEWKNAQAYIGKSVKVHKQSGELLEGEFLDVTENGNVLLKTKSDLLEISAFTVENIL